MVPLLLGTRHSFELGCFSLAGKPLGVLLTPLWTEGLGFRIPGTGFQSLSMEHGFWIQIVNGIPDSVSCIPGSIARDFPFHKQRFHAFRNSYSLNAKVKKQPPQPKTKYISGGCILDIVAALVYLFLRPLCAMMFKWSEKWHEAIKPAFCCRTNFKLLA